MSILLILLLLCCCCINEGARDKLKNHIDMQRTGKETLTPEQLKQAQNKIDSLQAIEKFNDLRTALPRRIKSRTKPKKTLHDLLELLYDKYLKDLCE